MKLLTWHMEGVSCYLGQVKSVYNPTGVILVIGTMLLGRRERVQLGESEPEAWDSHGVGSWTSALHL